MKTDKKSQICTLILFLPDHCILLLGSLPSSFVDGGLSFNPGNSLISTSMFPENPTLDHYRELFAGKKSLPYGTWYLNSLKISLFTMIGTVISVSLTGYAFSRFRFKGRKNGLTLFLLLQMIPQFSALVAIFVLAQLLGLVNSHVLLILLYIGGQIPMNTYLMKGYMDTIPYDLDESARIDGASHTKYLSTSFCRCPNR